MRHKHKLLVIGVFLVAGLIFGLVFNQITVFAQAPPQATALNNLLQAKSSSAHFALSWDVAAAGGGQTSSTHFKLISTIGQPVVGNSSSTHFSHHAGFWQNFLYKVFLPLLTR